MSSTLSHLQALNRAEASAIAAAATQIELALHEAHEPVEDLGSLIGQISATLGEMRAARSRRAPVATGAPAGDPGEMDAAIGRLEAALHGSIERLQFYDSMVQHLSHVRDYLAGVATRLAHAQDDAPASSSVSGEPRTWEGLRQQLRTRLLSDSQRELLDLVMPVHRGQHPPAQSLDARSPEGSIELF